MLVKYAAFTAWQSVVHVSKYSQFCLSTPIVLTPLAPSMRRWDNMPPASIFNCSFGPRSICHIHRSSALLPRNGSSGYPPCYLFSFLLLYCSWYYSFLLRTLIAP
mmetsp:Transcript_23923/g.49541  ORF Transcript_23923/g.49541 Transcript_23923/m.49541 type:complete len:105 (+) Transcript_23923:685-999(+)